MELAICHLCDASGIQKEMKVVLSSLMFIFFAVVRKCAHLPFKQELQTQISLEAKVGYVNFRSWCEKNGEMPGLVKWSVPAPSTGGSTRSQFSGEAGKLHFFKWHFQVIVDVQ